MRRRWLRVQELGRVISVRERNLVIVRSARLVKEGSPVYDEQQKKAGKVEEVIGPTRAPYVLIKVKGNPENLMGKSLYC